MTHNAAASTAENIIPADPKSTSLDGASNADSALLEFLWRIHSYTNDNIRFADSKAGIVIAISSGILAALFGIRAHHHCSWPRLSFSDPQITATISGTVSFLSILNLLFCALIAAWAVAPRLWLDLLKESSARFSHTTLSLRKAGPIYFGAVAAFTTPKEYWLAIAALQLSDQAQAVANHIFVLATIADRKFRWITLSIRFGYVGAILACLVLFAS